MIKRFSGVEEIKFPQLPHKKNHTRVTFTLPKSTVRAIHASMFKRDYGLRDKTRWILEAVEDYLDDCKHPFRKMLIIQCEGIRNKDAQSTILMPDELWKKTWHESMKAARYGANHEPPDFISPSVSLVIFAAILTRLTYENAEKTEVA